MKNICALDDVVIRHEVLRESISMNLKMNICTLNEICNGRECGVIRARCPVEQIIIDLY